MTEQGIQKYSRIYILSLWISITYFIFLLGFLIKLNLIKTLLCIFASLIVLQILLKFKEKVIKRFVVIDFYFYFGAFSALSIYRVFIKIFSSFISVTINNHFIVFFTILSIIAAIMCIPFAIRIFFIDVLGIEKDSLKKHSFLVKPTLILTAIYLLGLSALIRANYKYVDDMGRTLFGYKEWHIYFSRYLSSFFSTLVNADYYLTDISPFTQLIAIILTSISSVLAMYLVTNKKVFNFFDYLSIIPFGLSPYYLQCLSYKFDSPYIAFSILASIVPALFIDSKNKISLFIASMVGILIVCTTYQASAGIFPMLIVMICFVNIKNKNWSIKKMQYVIVQSILGYLFGILIFKFFIMSPIDQTSAGQYVSNNLPSFNNLIKLFFSNYYKYLCQVNRDFPFVWKVFICFILLFFIIDSFCESKNRKYVVLLGSIIVEVLLLIMTFGLYPALEKPLFAPRSMYGVGVLISFIGLSLSNFDVSKRIKGIGNLCVVAIGYMFFVFALTYGNSLYEQNEYINYRIENVAFELNRLLDSNDSREIQIKGDASFSPVVENEIENYPILQSLVPKNFREGNYWGIHKIVEYYKLPLEIHDLNDNLDRLNLPILIQTNQFTIKGNDKYILVELN